MPHPWINFNKETAIRFFGPPGANKAFQTKIFTTVQRATEANPGWGWSDWWNDRYVYLMCDRSDIKEEVCFGNKSVAYTKTSDVSLGYPIIHFCPVYFDALKPWQAVLKAMDANPDYQRNSMRARSQASTMLHEWLHMNWGTAEVCPGGGM